ncbi:MAG TPA: amylo-alpha-1,6-glucosidase [Terriglobales bacterium]|nr:amylo-alpha-1,6-glucosidase [Terriglobales bacterium]
MIRFGPETCGDLGQALKREWLETNGLGGFSCSTIVGLNTRRYHGLLTAATHPPVGRIVLLSKLEETLVLDGQRFDLSANQYPGVVHPQGFRYLRQFRLDPFPVFTYEIDGIEIEKAVFMVHGENTVVIEYAVRSKRPLAGVGLEVRPLIAFRDYHSTTHANEALNRSVEAQPGLAAIRPYEGIPTLYIAHDAAELDPSGDWFYNFEYAVERERGLDFQEDLFSPMRLRFDLGGRAGAKVIASTEPRTAGDAGIYRQREIVRRNAVLSRAPADDELVRQLVAAADQYIVGRGEGSTIIAGYPWFSDWGRDTMIALPGLTLMTGRTDVARGILVEFARHVDQGMLPNRFPDAGETPEYNTVDATLWFFEAIRAYLAYSGDAALVREQLYPVLADIIEWHVRGTRYGIRMDEDGLLASGVPGVQLTWMDAKIGDWVVTLRHGKPVEIQALWYNALRVMEEFARQFNDPETARRYGGMAAKANDSFNRLFWNESAGCLYDVVNGNQRDASIRPNQVLAASLPYSMLPRDKARQMLEVVERELLTPVGLRSLSPKDPQYRPRYEGDPFSRDSAYHQGTVWPWLMGPFLTAYTKTNGGTAKSRKQAMAWLQGFRQNLEGGGLGQVPEIFDAEPPHRPRGCFAQAWSVAELLRALVEDVLALEPKKPARRRAPGDVATRRRIAGQR